MRIERGDENCEWLGEGGLAQGFLNCQRWQGAGRDTMCPILAFVPERKSKLECSSDRVTLTRLCMPPAASLKYCGCWLRHWHFLFAWNESAVPFYEPCKMSNLVY